MESSCTESDYEEEGQREMRSEGALRSGPGCQGEEPFPVDLCLNPDP